MILSIIPSFLAVIPEQIAQYLPKICANRSNRQQKSDGSYVTIGDLIMQELLVSIIKEQLPEATIISEEFAYNQESTPEGLAIVIDPIDGTENFTSGLPEWGISIACYHNGNHAGSLLGCPEMGRWLGTGYPIASRHSSRIRGLSSSLSKEDILAATQGYEYRIMGCCVYNMLNVIQGSFCSFENPKGANSWDILAGLNLALEQGLIVTVDGNPYSGEYLPPSRKYRFKIEHR